MAAPVSFSRWLAGGAVCARGYHFSLTSTNSSIFHAPSSLPIQPREDLPDCPEVIRRVSGRGESGGSAHVVPIRAGGDDLSPFFGFVAQTGAIVTALLSLAALGGAAYLSQRYDEVRLVDAVVETGTGMRVVEHPATGWHVAYLAAFLVATMGPSRWVLRGTLAMLALLGADGRVFVTNSGTEANEAAFKLTRRTGRTHLVAAEGAFHGRTMGALALTHKPAAREPFEPLPGEVTWVRITIPSATVSVQDACGFGIPRPLPASTTSTRHWRQAPTGSSSGWSQNRGITMPSRSAVRMISSPLGAITSVPSMVSRTWPSGTGGFSVCSSIAVMRWPPRAPG